MKEDKLNGLLALGEDVIEFQDIEIKNYPLKYILSKDFGLDKYYYLVNFVNIEKEDLVEKYKIEDADNKSLFQCIWSQFDTKYWFLELLNTFTNLEWVVGDWEDYIAYDKNKQRHRFNEKKFNEFVDVFKKIYCVNNKLEVTESELEFESDQETKERLERIRNFEKENQNKNTDKTNITLMSIINGLVVKGLGYTYFNIYDLKIYQLMSLFYNVEHDEKCTFIKDIKANGLWDDKKNSNGNIHWAIDNSPI